jgi:phosphatidylethanolamine/phosphatidyl-N-methylethanolamine N-methyltransferase
MPIVWNRLRYTVWAPWYDALVAAADFGRARRRSIEGLELGPGARVLLIGAGTGLDLEYLPREVSIAAVDITPAMLERCRQRAERLGMAVDTRVMDARELAFEDDTFDAVVLHLVLAVMPEPNADSAKRSECSSQAGERRSSTSSLETKSRRPYGGAWPIS